MALNPLELLLLHNALTRPSPATDAAGAGQPTSAQPAVTTKEPSMANQFEFLDKHFEPTDLPEIAAQAAYERFGNYPNARTSTVIFNVNWSALTDAIKHAVLNYTNGGVYDSSAFATLNANGNQWNIVVTGLQYVNASRTIVRGRPEYEINEYNNGSVFIKAEALGAQLLGEIVHLDTGFGTWVQQVQLKNPPSF
ncbi:hypothetical protein [Lysobacter sp. ESA13C]|uniref:hypothetical protein n=1 Tax=unclassified Lysobacter TaxID=2635362 RepID=UPI001CBF4F15|nr:hypothetical protein [Lysobacter sp. ESA13C]